MLHINFCLFKEIPTGSKGLITESVVSICSQQQLGADVGLFSYLRAHDPINTLLTHWYIHYSSRG